MSEDFYRVEPTPHSAWRMAVLMGKNSRTYKFALGEALLDAAQEERDEIPLDDLATGLMRNLLRHMEQGPQASAKQQLRETDLLSVAAEEAEESRRIGRPTERAVQAAVKNIPGMVMQKFHNLNGAEVPHRFYELRGTPRKRVVILTEALQQVATSEQAGTLRGELDARWNIVELSFSIGIGGSLVSEGVSADLDDGLLYDRHRRRSVAGVADALIGFQHGRCQICFSPIAPGDAIAIDHVFPHALMRRLGALSGWHGPDLDLVWNLAPAHATCNGVKNDRPPTPGELDRLARRNDAIMKSPYPLSKSLELILRQYGYHPKRPGEWARFIRDTQVGIYG